MNEKLLFTEGLPYPPELASLEPVFDAMHAELAVDYPDNGCSPVAMDFIAVHKRADGVRLYRHRDHMDGRGLTPLPYRDRPEGPTEWGSHCVAYAYTQAGTYILDPMLPAPVLESDYAEIAFGLSPDELVDNPEEVEAIMTTYYA
jgi:hypothetical protein